jgi:hypothetical protein
MVVALVILTTTFIRINIRDHIPFHPYRKITILVQVAFTMVADYTLTILIFRIVLKIRTALDHAPSHEVKSSGLRDTRFPLSAVNVGLSKRYANVALRKTIHKVLLALSAMFLSGMLGLGVYIGATGVFGTH